MTYQVDKEQQKKAAALEAIAYVPDDSIIGVGTGSTANYFIEELAKIKNRIEGAIPSSKATQAKLEQYHIPIIDLNSVSTIPIYVDGADEINHFLQMIKGGGGALTREKIVASVAKQFICIADESKLVNVLGNFPLAIEVIPMARSLVGREMVKLGGNPQYRDGFVTDNGNIILDIYGLDFTKPMELEQHINNIPGVVSVGLFSYRPADLLLLATAQGVKKLLRKYLKNNLR